jgi:integrase
VLRTFFSWCETRTYLDDSPLRKLSKPSKTQSRKRVLQPDEIAAVWRTATELDHAYGHLIKLLLWTGQRRGEIAAFRRTFINPLEKTATLPSGLTKNGIEHVFVLGDETLAYLNALPGQTDLFFPAKNSSETPISGWGKWKIAFDERCPLPPWCLHDARRTFATTFPADPWVIEAHINHQSGTLTPIARVYNLRKYLAPAAAAMQQYEAQLRQLVAVPHDAA